LTFRALQVWALLPVCSQRHEPVGASPAPGSRHVLQVPADGWYAWAGAAAWADGAVPRLTPAAVLVGDGNVASCPPPAPPAPPAAPAHDPLDCWWLHSGTVAGRLPAPHHAVAQLADYRHDTLAWRSTDVTAGGDGGGDDPAACRRAGCSAFVRSQAMWLPAAGKLRLTACGGVAWALLPERPGACAVVVAASAEQCAEVVLTAPAAGWYVVAGAADSSATAALPAALRVTSLQYAADAADVTGSMVSSCAAGDAAAAAAVSTAPLPRSFGALSYLLSPHNLDELAWSLATVCAACAWAPRYELLFIVFAEDLAALSTQLAAPRWRRAARCFRGGAARLVVTDPTAAHRSASASAALSAGDGAALDRAWEAFAARQPRSRFGVGYRKMVWFWTFGVLADARLGGYRYLWRLDTDSELLAPLRVDLFEQLATQRRVLGYHCWTYESPPVARGFTAAAGEAAAAAGALPSAWAGYSPQGASADAPAGMLYNNFMVIDLAHFGFAARPAAARVLVPLLPGVLAHRWGDALAWGMLAGLFANESTAWHVDGMAYNHGRGYTQMLLPGNAERVTWDAATWAATHRGGPRGGCTDPRVRWTHRVALKAWRARHGVF